MERLWWCARGLSQSTRAASDRTIRRPRTGAHRSGYEYKEGRGPDEALLEQQLRELAVRRGQHVLVPRVGRLDVG